MLEKIVMAIAIAYLGLSCVEEFKDLQAVGLSSLGQSVVHTVTGDQPSVADTPLILGKR